MPDRRITPWRDDLAAEHLKGAIDSARYAPSRPFSVIVETIPLRAAPDKAAPYASELLYGENFAVYDIADSWAWGQADRDDYVGYVPLNGLARGRIAPTHRVAALRSFRYPGPAIKATPLGFLPYGAEIAVEAMEGRFARTGAGYVFVEHLVPLEYRAADPIREARRFLGIPYLWGGKSSLGLDCSGLVQTILRACGLFAPRDSDMQEKALGAAVTIPDDPSHFRRGDLLFWPGHVAFAEGDGNMIHATAHAMAVISEPLGPALARIEAKGHALRSVRRLTIP